MDFLEELAAHPCREGGSGHHLLESGDGRSRFMAMVGMICSSLFLLGVVVALGILYSVAGCNV